MAHYTLEPGNHLSFLSEWDGPIYLNLAAHGYTSSAQAGFFPFYPLLVRALHWLIPSLLLSGLLVSWIALVGAIYFYLKIIKRLYRSSTHQEALRAVLFFVLFPTGIFLLATYTESVFACVGLGALYYTLQKKYWWAALLAALSTATHATGLFVVALLALLMLEQREKLVKVAKVAAAGCLGLLSFMAFSLIRFHNAWAFVDAQKAHSWVNLGPLHLLSTLATRNGLFFFLDLLAALYWWRRRKSFSVYCLLFAAILLISSQSFSGFGRYNLMVFPLQLMLYDYSRNKRLVYTLLLVASAILWTYFLLLYSGGYGGG